MKKVFLHIGTPKTGTTSVQKYFNSNKAELQNFGILYPNVGLREAGHHDLAECLLWDYNNKEDIWHYLTKEIVSSHCSKSLISSEMFAFLESKDIVRLRHILNFADIKIILCLRNHHDLIISGFKQEIKVGTYYGSLIGYVEKIFHLLDYLDIVKRWQKVFGEHNVIILEYDSINIDGNLIHVFEKIIFGKFIYSKPDSVAHININKGLNLSIIYLLNKINYIYSLGYLKKILRTIRIRILYDARVRRIVDILFTYFSHRWLNHQIKTLKNSPIWAKVNNYSIEFKQYKDQITKFV